VAQSLSILLVHLVFSTKNRQPWIRPEIEDELYAYLAGVCRELDSPALAINGTNDHVHILVRMGKKTALADLIEEVKKRSSKWIKTRSAAYQDFYWQAGYGAFSIGQSSVDSLKRYIADQKEHHRTRTFQEELRAILRKYNVECDERYVWD
jgi:REP-associated tyrosine transposase